MTYDVVVVGGGIGGLTVAALLSARGVSVCLLERQSQVGGCVARVQFGEHEFDPGFGMYSGWGDGEIYKKVFAELPVESPQASVIDSEVVVRLTDRTDVRLYKDDTKFFAELRRAFPGCSESALKFYQGLMEGESEGSRASLFTKAFRRLRPTSVSEKSILDVAAETSQRFKGFVDTQLRTFTNTTLEDTTLAAARVALSTPRQYRYSIKGGPASLAERLAESIPKSFGKVRLDSPVLRIAYNESGSAIGVDLLSGETVLAKHAIVSNLTIWDTYGKLVGLNRTPQDVKASLSNLNGSGMYLLFATLEEAAVSRLPSDQMLLASQTDDASALTFTASPLTELETLVSKRSVTVSSQVDVNDWFTYQSSQEDLEEWDQAALERVWEKLHRALPELGGDIEVIETANPRTFYETTRRKLGMVMGAGKPSAHETFLPNLFMIGDTVSEVPTVASVTQSALELADKLTKLVNR